MNILDLVIVGAGPAGITAAIYAKRYGMSFEILEKAIPGGNVVNAHEIENYPGFTNINGFELALNFQKNLKSLGVKVISDEVTSITKNDEIFEVKTKRDRILHSKYVILALGSTPRSIGLAKEDKFYGRGISYCATCDGTFYKDKDVIIVGGGNSAINEGLYLSTIVKSLTVLVRSKIRASEKDTAKLRAKENVTILENTEITELIEENNKLIGVNIIDKSTNTISYKPIDGIFVYIGSYAPTNFLQNLNIFAENGYIKVDDSFETEIKGLFAVGDVINKYFRQIVTAQGDAANAIEVIKHRLK